MFISPVSNLSLSDHVYGEDISISCSVDTCVSDIVLQLFKDDQLLHMSMSSMGNRITGSAQVKVSDELVGEYACQVMSDSRNEVVRETFSVRGKYIQYFVLSSELQPLVKECLLFCF